MIVAVTGTPGTGKTTATELLASGDAAGEPSEARSVEASDGEDIEPIELEVVHLNEDIRSEGLTSGHDEDRDSEIADFEAVRAWVADRDDLLVESHLAHEIDADRVVVLRCDPAVVERRLRERGESEASARENAESEALDLVLAEAVDRHGPEAVYEIDATDLSPTEVAAEIAAVVRGDREPRAGIVSFMDYLVDPGPDDR